MAITSSEWELLDRKTKEAFGHGLNPNLRDEWEKQAKEAREYQAAMKRLRLKHYKDLPNNIVRSTNDHELERI